jgi:hypothetical protein
MHGRRTNKGDEPDSEPHRYQKVGTMNRAAFVLIFEFYYAMQEMPFSCLDENAEAYRFLFIPTFESPVSVNVWREGDHKYIALRQLYAVGRPMGGAKDMKKTVNRQLTEKAWIHFQEVLENSTFWSMPADDVKPMGLDGSTFLLEGGHHHRYHVVNRLLPEDQHFLELCN